MILVVVVLFVSCVYALYALFKRDAGGHKMPPVYPGALPIIGHTHLPLLWGSDAYGFLTSMTDFCLKSGGVTCGYFAGKIYYGIVDPEDAATVCNSMLQKPDLMENLGGPLFGQGLISGSGVHYRQNRKLLNPAFGLPVVYQFLDIFNSQYKRVSEIFGRHVGKGPFDTVDIFKWLTLRTSCITVFGEKDEKDDQFLNQYTTALDEIFKIVIQRIEKPWLLSDFIYGFTNLKKIQDRNIQLLDKISYEVIERQRMKMKSKESLEKGNDSGDTVKPFVDILLELGAEGALTDKNIRDELNTIVGASYETTSQQLTFLALYIGSYPEVQEKLYREIMEVVGDRDVEKQDLSKLVYTEAVIKESLRTISSIPLVPRHVDRDLKLKNYTLRAGSCAFFMPGGIHRHPSWGPDADVFRPERWLDKEMAPKLSKLLFAFSTGARSCVGRSYAIVALKVALVHMVREFRLKADVSKMKLTIEVFTRPISGHEITVERRNTKNDLNHNIPLSIFNERKVLEQDI